MSLPKVLVTWDIDGTLLIGKNRGVTHHKAFEFALKKVFGAVTTPIFRPGTDLGISKDIIKPVTGKDEVDPQKLQEFIRATEDYYIDEFDGRMEILPGVFETLDALSRLDNVTMGLCTGNFERIGWLKLEKAGLMPFFKDRIGGFGCKNEDRTEILKEAIQNAKRIKDIQQFDRIMHIGDSPADVKAANDIGAISILVQTSPHKFKDFPPAQYVFKDLKSNFEDLMAIIKQPK